MTRHFSPREVLRILAADAQDPRFIGTPYRLDGNEPNGFGIRCGDGFAVIFGFEQNNKPIWWLRMVAGIALDVPDIDGSLRWVNEQNRGIYAGCYLCGIDQSRGLAGVVYQISFSSLVMDSDSELVFAFMTNMMTTAVNIAATEPSKFIERHGGVPFHEYSAYSLPMMV